MEKRIIKTKAEAVQHAIDWQSWASSKELSYGGMNEWQIYFEDIAGRFGLYDEFKENGII